MFFIILIFALYLLFPNFVSFFIIAPIVGFFAALTFWGACSVSDSAKYFNLESLGTFVLVTIVITMICSISGD